MQGMKTVNAKDADERNIDSQFGGYRVGTRGDWNITKVTGSASQVVTSAPAHLHLVRNHDDGQIHAFIDVLQQIQDGFGCLWIQCGSSFITEQYFW